MNGNRRKRATIVTRNWQILDALMAFIGGAFSAAWLILKARRLVESTLRWFVGYMSRSTSDNLPAREKSQQIGIFDLFTPISDDYIDYVVVRSTNSRFPSRMKCCINCQVIRFILKTTLRLGVTRSRYSPETCGRLYSKYNILFMCAWSCLLDYLMHLSYIYEVHASCIVGFEGEACCCLYNNIYIYRLA